MLKWMMRITRLTRKNRAENVEMDDENNEDSIDKIRTEEMVARAGVANVSENIRETALG